MPARGVELVPAFLPILLSPFPLALNGDAPPPEDGTTGGFVACCAALEPGAIAGETAHAFDGDEAACVGALTPVENLKIGGVSEALACDAAPLTLANCFCFSCCCDPTVFIPKLNVLCVKLVGFESAICCAVPL
jgi:hypothetical protein